MNIESTVATFGGGRPQVPRKLAKLIADLQTVYTAILPEYRDSAEVEIWSSEDSDGCEDVHLKITVERPESPEEAAVRLKGEREHWTGQLKIASDRAAYCIGQIEKLEKDAS